MSLPRLREVRIAVADLEAALEAWRFSIGLKGSIEESSHEATIQVGGDCLLRLVEVKDGETAGLAGLVIAVDKPAALALLTGALSDAAGTSIAPSISFGVPIQVEAAP